MEGEEDHETEYHWYILAHQNVTKLNANDYSTSMTAYKFKLAHKRAGQDKWSASVRAQRTHLITPRATTRRNGRKRKRGELAA